MKLNKLFEIINENILKEYILNIFDKNQKEKIIHDIWPMMIQTYDNIGGLNIEPKMLLDQKGLWKFAKENNVIIAGILFREYYGLKIRLVFSNQTISAKEKLKKMLLDVFKHNNAWVECSGPLENFLEKNNVKKVPAEIVKNLLPDIISIYDDKFHYERKIDNEIKKQIVFGNPKI